MVQDSSSPGVPATSSTSTSSHPSITTSIPRRSTSTTGHHTSSSSSSAFSRLANLASLSTTNSSSSGGGGSPSPVSVSTRGGSGALDALESIVAHDNTIPGGGVRQRHGSTESTKLNRTNWRDSSNSRSRERERERSDSSGFIFMNESHFFNGGVGGGGAGAGSSGFSFEQQHSSSNGNGYWDGSYRSSITGSPSIFLHRGTSSTSNSIRYPWNDSPSSSSSSPFQSNRLPPPRQTTTNTATSTTTNSPRAQSPTATTTLSQPQLVLSRSASPLGGGRKLKETSRGLNYRLSVNKDHKQEGLLEKGLIGLAKPPKNGLIGNGSELGRVAVAGKHSLKILKVPHGPFPSLYSSTRRPPNANSSYANVARSSSIADRRSRSRGPRNNTTTTSSSIGSGSGSASSGSGFIGIGRRDPSVDTSLNERHEEEAEREGGVDEEPLSVEELMDVRHGSRLSPSYLFQDVRWGYGATSNKLATACTNGAVILWDLNRDSGNSKLDQVKYEHDRAVNRIVFGGQTGNWLMSGGQDGQMKLWDIRESRPSSMILKASSPVRHLSFSPSASQPFTLLAACASGTLIRYDVRYISRQNGGATDRIAGHIGSCLAMDWRDGFDCERTPINSTSSGGSVSGGDGIIPGVSVETAGGFREGGWVVTGGIDQTIKIWDFSLPTLATKPMRTLYPSQPVQSVSWHPVHGSELASSPLPSLSLGARGGGDDNMARTPTNKTDIPLLRGGGGESSAGDNDSWKSEISIWDTRRPYFPKLSIKTAEPTSAILFNDDETIWSTSKTSTTFHQHDTASDSYSLLDCIDRPSTAWNLEGDFMFVDDARTAFDVPFERTSRANVPVNSDKFVPDVFVASVTDLDPDFSTESFSQLANNLQLTGDFDEICEHNVHVSFLAGRPDAAQVWAVLKTWFGQSPLSRPSTPPLTPPTGEDEESAPAGEDENRAASPIVAAAPDWILSPTSTTYSDAASKSNRHHRFSLSSMRSTPSTGGGGGRRQTSTDTFDSSTTALPPKDRDNVKQLLDTFSEESTASETDPSNQSPYYPELSSTSSDSEELNSRSLRRRQLHKGSVASLPTNRLAASLAALADSQQRDVGAGGGSELSLDDLHKHSSRTPSRLASRRNSTSSSASTSSSSDSSSSLDDNNDNTTTARKSSRSAKIAALHASLIANRSRRPSAGQSSERRPLSSRDSSTLAGRKNSRKPSAEGNGGDSRRGSAARMATNRTTSTGGILAGGGGTKQDLKGSQKVLTSKDLGREAAVKHADEAFEIVKQQLKATLIDYADRGDSQLCAVVCCVLQDQDLGFDSLWVARVTKAYLDMLRRLDLHVPAATLNKYCSTESLRNLTQDSVIFHTACGRCGKGIETPPYDYCPKCRMIVTRCGICHLAVDSLYVFCACCGHGLHEKCLHDFAGLHSISQPQTPNTVPSTPGIATPLRHWLFREGTSVVDSEDEEGLSHEAQAERLAILLSYCPSACSHSC